MESVAPKKVLILALSKRQPTWLNPVCQEPLHYSDKMSEQSTQRRYFIWATDSEAVVHVPSRRHCLRPNGKAKRGGENMLNRAA